MSVIRRSIGGGGNTLEPKCAAALAEWETIEEPAAIEEAVLAFLPRDQPFRDDAIEMLGKMMSVDMSRLGGEDEMVNALVSAATLRVVRASQVSGRGRSQGSVSRRLSADDTLDMIKVVIVGDSGVGKTCLMLRFVKDEFVSSTRATIGMDFCTRQLAVDVLSSTAMSTVQRLTVQVWDTAGQEQFHSLTATYYRKAGGVMIVYDSTSRVSFEGLPKWLRQVNDNAEDVVKMIVATKMDEGGTPAVTLEEGAEFASANGCLFASTSSKLGDGVIRAFSDLATHVLANQESKESEKETLWLNAPRPGAATPKKGGCC